MVHNPVDATRFDPARIDRATAREQLGFGERELVLGVVAQLTPWKGQDDAIRILARLLPEHPDMRLVVAGSAKFTAPSARFDNAAFERRLREMAAELGVKEKTLFAGECRDVPQLLAALDVLLVPSWREAFGRIALEGMAMELPVLATRVGGPGEIVRDGLDGLLLPPRQPDVWAGAVAELVADPGRRREMGRAGRSRALQEFTVQRHVNQVAAVYDAVLNGRDHRRGLRRAAVQ